MYNMDYMIYYAIAGVMTMIGAAVSGRLKSKFAQYSKVALSKGQSGRDIAAEMLAHYGISDVKIVRGKGVLTDHYNPVTKKLALSSAVFDRASISAIGVATHEAGHAIQHATGYYPLKWRSMIVPVADIGTKFGTYGMMIGVAIIAAAQPFGETVFIAGALAFLIFVLFQLVTLPVEFNASSLAKQLVVEAGIVGEQERDGIDKVLGAAAMTYVAAFISSVLTLVYFLMKSGLLKSNERQHGY